MGIRMRLLALVITALELAALVAVPVVRGRPDREWDARVVHLAAFVEEQRGRRFLHPVEVEFLDDGGFETELPVGASDPYEAAEARALGLARADDDAPSRLSVSRYVGVYLPATDRVIVRGTALSPFAAATVVHELTHALDDQHFDLRGLGGRRPRSYGERLAQRAVVEASASLVEDAFVDRLRGADRRAYGAELERRRAARRRGASARPAEAASEIFSAPYRLGPTFVREVAAASHGGDIRAAVDTLLRSPPRSDVAIAWPKRFLTGDDRGRGDLGVVRLRAVLAAHLGDRAAADAVARAWRRDSMRRYERGGRSCVGVEFGVDGAARSLAAVALTSVAARLPAAEVRLRADGMPVLHACDPLGEVSRRR